MEDEGFDEFFLYPENDKEKAILDFIGKDAIAIVFKK